MGEGAAEVDVGAVGGQRLDGQDATRQAVDDLEVPGLVHGAGGRVDDDRPGVRRAVDRGEVACDEELPVGQGQQVVDLVSGMEAKPESSELICGRTYTSENGKRFPPLFSWRTKVPSPVLARLE